MDDGLGSLRVGRGRVGPGMLRTTSGLCVYACNFICMQMSLADDYKHKSNITTIAERAVAQGRNAMLGVPYDELARFHPLISRLARAERFHMLQGGLGGSIREVGRYVLHCDTGRNGVPNAGASGRDFAR